MNAHTELITSIGTDATVVFEDIGHTLGARDLAKQYMIGNIADQVSCL